MNIFFVYVVLASHKSTHNSVIHLYTHTHPQRLEEKLGILRKTLLVLLENSPSDDLIAAVCFARCLTEQSIQVHRKHARPIFRSRTFKAL